MYKFRRQLLPDMLRMNEVQETHAEEGQCVVKLSVPTISLHGGSTVPPSVVIIAVDQSNCYHLLYNPFHMTSNIHVTCLLELDKIMRPEWFESGIPLTIAVYQHHPYVFLCPLRLCIFSPRLKTVR